MQIDSGYAEGRNVSRTNSLGQSSQLTEYMYTLR